MNRKASLQSDHVMKDVEVEASDSRDKKKEKSPCFSTRQIVRIITAKDIERLTASNANNNIALNFIDQGTVIDRREQEKSQRVDASRLYKPQI